MILSSYVQEPPVYSELAFSYRHITARYESTLFHRISPTPSLGSLRLLIRQHPFTGACYIPHL